MLMQAQMLRQLVYHELLHGPMSGYDLCKEIEASTGHRPSYGSIYPLLQQLHLKGEVEVATQGRKKLYSLTRAGKRIVLQLEEERRALVDDVKVKVRALFNVMGHDPGQVLTFLERLKAGTPPLGPISEEAISMRNTLFRLATDGRAERHAAVIRRKLKAVRRDLEALQ